MVVQPKYVSKNRSGEQHRSLGPVFRERACLQPPDVGITAVVCGVSAAPNTHGSLRLCCIRNNGRFQSHFLRLQRTDSRQPPILKGEGAQGSARPDAFQRSCQARR